MSVVDDHRTIDFVVTGMTCGSCAARVERVLGKQPGVAAAAVNFARETVAVTGGGEIDPAALVAAVEAIGYGLQPTTDLQADVEHAESTGRSNPWLLRVLVAWPLAIAVLVLSLGFMEDQWARYAAMVLCVPVQFWAGRSCIRRQFGRAAVKRTWTP